ncbi:MAG: antirepressor regulating drug resistance protein, partial [Capsulimonas sp.]|nr:antirepressor regulating drug resistance protein [Capsulimonas sp.]
TARPEEAAMTAPADPRPRLLIGVWAIVALGALIRLTVGMMLAGRTARRASLVTDTVLTQEIRRLAKEAGIGRRDVELRQSAVAVPMTTGLRRPIVLLPMGAEAWPVPLRTAALRHELAHIARRDWAWHALAGVVCALHWFNPMAWVAAKQMRAESERACDDAVLASGIRPTDYAGHLLEIAKHLSQVGAPRPGAAIAMAQRPQVEDRLRAILQTSLSRRAASRPWVMAALAVTVLILAPVAALRTAAQDQSEAKARQDAEKMVSLSNLRQLGLRMVEYATEHGGALPRADRWVDEGAQVFHDDPKFIQSLMRDPGAPATQTYGYAFNKALSGVNLVTLQDPAHVVLLFESTRGTRNAFDGGESVPVPGRHEGGTHYLFADGRVSWVPDGQPVVFTPTIGQQAKTPSGPLGRASLTGRVIYEDGKPAANVRVGAQMQNDAMDALWGAAQGNSVLPHGVRIPLPPGAARPSVDEARRVVWGEATTAADGTYQIHGLTSAPYNIAVLFPDAPPGTGPEELWVAAAIEGAKGQEGASTPLQNLVLTSGGFIAGRVTDAEGKPRKSVHIASYGPHRPRSSAMVLMTDTDFDGRYRLRVAPGESEVYIADGPSPEQNQTVTVAKGETKTVNFTVAAH